MKWKIFIYQVHLDQTIKHGPHLYSDCNNVCNNGVTNCCGHTANWSSPLLEGHAVN